MITCAKIGKYIWMREAFCRIIRQLEMKTETLVVFFFALICATFGQLKTGRGAYDGRIVGGVDIRIEEAPYQVSLQYFNEHMCGGSIISKSFVVTAAHCKFQFFGKCLRVIKATKNPSQALLASLRDIFQFALVQPRTMKAARSTK